MASKTRTLKLSDASKDLAELADDAFKGDRIILEKDGAGVAVLISRDEYESLLRTEARMAFRKFLEDTWEVMKNVEYEDVERDILEYVETMRGRPPTATDASA